MTASPVQRTSSPAGMAAAPAACRLHPGDRLVRGRRDERRRERHGDQLRRCRRADQPLGDLGRRVRARAPGGPRRGGRPPRSRRASVAAYCLSASVRPPGRCRTATTIDSYDWSGQHCRTSSAARRLSAPPASIFACPSAASRVRSGDSTPTTPATTSQVADHPARPAARQALDHLHPHVNGTPGPSSPEVIGSTRSRSPAARPLTARIRARRLGDPAKMIRDDYLTHYRQFSDADQAYRVPLPGARIVHRGTSSLDLPADR